MNVVYLNNKKVEAYGQISLFNPTFLYGINCFEGIRAYWNERIAQMVFFDLKQHIDRLYVSAEKMHFNVKISKDDLILNINKILEAEQVKENVYLRITFFIDQDTSWSEREHISYIISFRSMASELLNSQSISLMISSVERISSKAMPPSVKAGANYLNSRYALLEAKKQGFEGALFLSQKGVIAESTGSCIFFIKDDVIYTPSAECDILIGITRNRIIQLSNAIGIITIETEIKEHEIKKFEGAFLAGTMIEIKPINCINDNKYNPSHPLTEIIKKAVYNYIYEFDI